MVRVTRTSSLNSLLAIPAEESFMSSALLDNSGFAGVMRCYRPEMAAHRTFLDRFPEHREVDHVSTAQFLTALCIYDHLSLEGSSSGHEDSQADVIADGTHRIRRDFCSSWVMDLLKELPSEVSSVISANEYSSADFDQRNFRSRRLAFTLYASPLVERLRLRRGEKLPDVYTAESHVDRPFFERMNSQAGSPLSPDFLAQAMFLHRGLLLEACADTGSTYLPYLYRGRMLECVPPSVARQINGSADMIVPLASDTLPGDTESVRILSGFYYDMLARLTWTRYDDTVPFIGAAILAKTGFALDRSFDLAMELRQEGRLRALFGELDEHRETGDRVMYEIAIDEIKSDLAAAGRHLGLRDANPDLQALWSLATFWLPEAARKAAEGAIALLPSGLRRMAERVAGMLLTAKPHQMLLIDHTSALRAVRTAGRK